MTQATFWTSVSARLPEESGWYLCLIKTDPESNILTPVVHHYSALHKQFNNFDSQERKDDNTRFPTIAWAHVPPLDVEV